MKYFGEKPGWAVAYEALRCIDEPLPEVEPEPDPKLVISPTHASRRLEVAQVFYGGQLIGCERTSHGKPFCIRDGRLAANAPHVAYWSERTYADKAVAGRDAAQFGGTVMESFYGEGLFFLSFDDVRKLIALETR